MQRSGKPIIITAVLLIISLVSINTNLKVTRREQVVFKVVTAEDDGHIDKQGELQRNDEELQNDKHEYRVENVSTTCPPPPNADDRSDIPQVLTFGRFPNEKGDPFITQDFWADIVDNRRTFFLRPKDAGYPSIEQLQGFIRSRTHPITLVINNQHDESWPEDLGNKTAYELILNEPKLHAVFAGNARELPDHPKLKQLPIGLKWNWRSTRLFSEPKDENTKNYKKFGSPSPVETERLFRLENRTSTVFLRPMMNSNKRTRKYVRDTPALQMKRVEIFDVLNGTAPKSLINVVGKLDQEGYYQELRKHRFVVSPPGNGLDSHSTWEALLVGCIPIVAKSALDPVFEDLPVWKVNDWRDVTDDAVKKMEEELLGKAYNWEKVFRSFWETEIYKGLCTV